MKLKLGSHFLKADTVLESPPPHDEECDIWSQQGYLPPVDPESRRGQKNRWCRPSCIPISIICVLIFLVVLLPLLDSAAEKALQQINKKSNKSCQSSCGLSLIESIPEGLIYENSSISHASTYQTWLDLIELATESIEIGSYYWSLRQNEIFPDPSSYQGEEVFQALLSAGLNRGIEIKIVQNVASQSQPNTDTEYLVKRNAAKVRSLNFPLLGIGGILHTKLWIIDRKHMYVGSANMDWRSLTQVKELGVLATNCSCLVEDAAKIFEVYWALAENNSKIPDKWPSELSTNLNMNTPLNLSVNNDIFPTYLSSSPPQLSPDGRTNDIDALINVINTAEKFVYISVMDYFPITLFSPKMNFWPVIDDALRKVALESKIKVKLLISWWRYSRESEDYFLNSLQSLNGTIPGVNIEIRRFVVPANATQSQIPYARVNHNKYMVTDNTAFIGTSNWSGDYFIDTAGVSFVSHDPVFDRDSSHVTIRSELQDVFERDWNSEYSHPLHFNKTNAIQFHEQIYF